MSDLDKKDRRILAELDRNARISYSQLARAVSLSQEGVRYRVNRLEDAVIKDYVTVLNHDALGRRSYRVFFKLQDPTVEVEEAFVDLVRDDAAWVVRVRGGWSFNTMFFADDAYAMEDLLNRVKDRFSEALLDVHVSIVTRIYHYPRSYYLDEYEGETIVMGEREATYDRDEKDEAVLRSLRRHARQKTVDVARDTGLSERVVRYRVKQLEEANVIQGYRALPDLEALSRSYYKVHFYLNEHGSSVRGQLRAYAERHAEVVYLTEAVGGFDLELEYQVVSERELYDAVDDLVSSNPGLVRDYDVLLYDKEYQLSYFNKVSS